jgi:hypothetical protein
LLVESTLTWTDEFPSLTVGSGLDSPGTSRGVPCVMAASVGTSWKDLHRDLYPVHMHNVLCMQVQEIQRTAMRPASHILKGCEREVRRKKVTRPLDQGEQQLRAKTRRSAPPESPLVRLGRMTGLHGALSGREYAGKGGSGARPAAGCNSIATPPSRQRPRPRTDNVVKCEHPGADRTWGQLLAGWYLGRRSRRRAEGWTEMWSW